MALERPHLDKPEGDIPFDLGIEGLVVGDGEETTSGAKVAVHYVGVGFSSGEFDASWNRGEAFRFTLGKGTRHPFGWDRGVVGMRVGGRRQAHGSPRRWPTVHAAPALRSSPTSRSSS